MLCKTRRALYARLSDATVMNRSGSFKAAFYAFDAHEATCPICQHGEAFAIQPAPWRRHGVKRLTWRFRFPVRAYNLRRGLHRSGAVKPAYESASIWYRIWGRG